MKAPPISSPSALVNGERRVALVHCALLASLSACASSNYIGDTYPATRNVDVYYATKDVKREYKVIGHISASASVDEKAAKDRIIAKAQMVGADAIIITGLDFTGGKDSVPFNRADAIKYTKGE